MRNGREESHCGAFGCGFAPRDGVDAIWRICFYGAALYGTSRVVIEEKVADQFVSMLVERAKKFSVGDGLEPGVEMGPSVDESQMNTVLRYIEIGKSEGKLLCGGERLRGPKYDKGWFVTPTVFDHVRPQSAIAQDEIFGPVLSVIRVKDFDEALDVANSVRYGLTSAIYSTDSNKIFEFVDKIQTGMTHANSPTVGGEAHVPFGGTKATSVGPKEVGNTALDFYTGPQDRVYRLHRTKTRIEHLLTGGQVWRTYSFVCLIFCFAFSALAKDDGRIHWKPIDRGQVHLDDKQPLKTASTNRINRKKNRTLS